LQALLDDLTGSIARAGFQRQLLVNGHGGNRGPLMAIAGEFVASGRAVGMVDYFAPASTEAMALLQGKARGVTHAGEMETALMLALSAGDAQERIGARASGLAPRLKGTQADVPGPIAQAGAWWPSIYGAGDVGYSGDPATATVATGVLLAAIYAERLAEFYAAFAVAELALGGMPARN